MNNLRNKNRLEEDKVEEDIFERQKYHEYDPPHEINQAIIHQQPNLPGTNSLEDLFFNINKQLLVAMFIIIF